MADPRTNRERMLAGDFYIADDPELEAAMMRASRLADDYNALAPRDREAASALLPELLGGVGAETVVRAPLYVDYGKRLTIGARTFVNFGLVALDVAPIAIGDDSVIGAGAVVTKDVPAGVLAVGNPARVIGAL